jgi:hypothetical protein
MRLSKKTSKSKKFAECDLSLPVRKFLNREGYVRVIRELPFFDRSIDVYGVSWADEAKTADAAKTIAVELKLSKWQKALHQAALYQLCSDYSYVAMPRKVAQTLVEHEDFKTAGVGILAVDTISKAVEIVLPAALSTQAKGHYLGPYKEMLRR